MSPRARVGIAVGAELLTAVELCQSWSGARPGRVWSWTLPSCADDKRQAALCAALDELADAFAAMEVSASIALLRPLAQAKVITTPPVGRRALEQLVQRNASRYFITGADATLATASPLGAAMGRSSTRAVAVCAAEQTVADVAAAAAAGGIAVERITAAPLALREAIRALVPGTRRGTVAALVGGAGWAEALLVDDGVLRLALPLPLAGLTDAESTARAASRLIADSEGCGARPTRLLLLSGDVPRDEAAQLIVAAADAGVSPVPVPASVTGLSADALAAFGAALAGGRTPSLATDTLRVERRRASLRRTASIYAVAATMLAVSAVAHLWSLEHRLDAVEASRRALAPALAPVMAERRTIDAARSTLEALGTVERASQRWTGALAALARALPDSAYLLSLSTSGTTLQLTGLAASVHSVVAPLEASPVFSEVALGAASQRDGVGGRQRFQLSVNLDAPAPITGAMAGATLVQPARSTDQ
jgi:Tfp pilus assembly protein PilN